MWEVQKEFAGEHSKLEIFVPQMLVVFMLGWMVFTMTDIASTVGFGNVANEAHLGGLLVGLATGWYYSSKRSKA